MALTDEMIIDYVENFDSKGIRVVILGTATRSGSFLLHSLLDNHPEILQLPVHHFFYFDWEYALKFSTPENLIRDYRDKGFALNGKKTGLGENQDISIDIRYNDIFDCMERLLPRLTSVTRKTLFLLFYFSYAQLFDVDLSRIKVLFHHSHYINNAFGYYSYRLMRERMIRMRDLENLFQISANNDPILEAVLEDFPNLKMIIPFRHPMSGTYSFVKHLEAHPGSQVLHPSDLSSYFNRSFHSILSCYSVLGIRKRLGDQLKLVRFEDMHNHTQTLMRGVADFMGIEFTERIMLESTFWGHQWNAQDVTRGGKPMSGTSPERLKDQDEWKREWDEDAQKLFGLLSDPLSETLGYEPCGLAQSRERLSRLTEQEETIYREYPLYLTDELKKFLQELSETSSGECLLDEAQSQPVREKLEAYQEKLLFWQNYANIRSRTLERILKVAQSTRAGVE